MAFDLAAVRRPADSERRIAYTRFMGFVELQRRFIKVKPDDELDPEVRGAFARMRLTSMSWEEILKEPRVVVLAEAGTGKTEEAKAMAHKLAAQGKNGFFCSLERLAEDGLYAALEDLNAQHQFAAWLAGDQVGTFLLDSVDEAKLAGQSFENALRNFAHTIGAALARVSVIVTSRISDWYPQTDLATFDRWLPIRPRISTSAHSGAHAAAPDAVESVKTRVESSPAPATTIVLLAPLNRTQQETLFSAADVRDVLALMDAVERTDADIFVERPQDLLEVAQYWNEYGALGSLCDMVEFNVDHKLRERDPQRDRRRQLSTERSRAGAEHLAAMLTLCRKNEICIPDAKIAANHAAHSVDARLALSSWGALEIEALLTRPIFDKATYGRIRFHHRSVREYLTACWLRALLEKNAPIRSIERLLIRKQYGREVVIPSMRPVAAWLGQWDARIRRRLFEVAPEVLIEGGDPAAMHIDERAMLLRHFAAHHVAKGRPHTMIDLAAVRRLADPRLAPEIRTLFAKYWKVTEVRELLLRIIWQAKIGECADLALKCALDTKLDVHTRDCSVRAIGAAGNAVQKRKLAEALLQDASASTDRILDQACRALFPDTLSVGELLTFVDRSLVPSRRTVDFGIASALEQHAAGACTSGARAELLSGMLERLQRPPHVKDISIKISVQFAWLLPAVAELTRCCLDDRPIRDLGEDVLQGVEIVGCAQEYAINHSLDIKALRECVSKDRRLNRALFWRSVHHRRQEIACNNGSLRSWWEAQQVGMMWTLEYGDFDMFVRGISEQTNSDDREVALTAAFKIWHDSGGETTQLAVLEAACTREVALVTRLQQLLNPVDTPEGRQWRERQEARVRERELRKRMEEEEERAYVSQLQRDPERLQDEQHLSSTEVFPHLLQFVRSMGEHGVRNSRWGQSNWRALIERFGLEVAEAARNGLRRYWRQFNPPVRSEQPSHQGTPNGTIVGLSGLAIEALENAEWAGKLSQDEARLAARYATQELNGFPEWTRDLVACHRNVVDEVFSREIAWEFEPNQEGAPHHVVASLRYGDATIRGSLAASVFVLLKAREPRHDETLDNVLSILLRTPELDLPAMALLAEQRCLSASSQSRKLTWLTAWMCLDAGRALVALGQWLEQVPEGSDRDRRMIAFCGALIERHDVRFGTIYRDFERIEHLMTLIPLAFAHVRPDEDNVHDEVYSPDERDNAEWLRHYLLERLGNTEGPDAHDALLRLAQKRSPLPDYVRESCRRSALRRTELDAEEEWLPQDVTQFAGKFGRAPRSDGELFELVQWRLDGLTLDLQHGDFSEARLLATAQAETDAQIWFAARLREKAGRLYTVAREQEVIAAKKPDIRVNSPHVASPVVIEVKIADNWTLSDLQKGLKTQLIGQYLRDRKSRNGVYLLTYHGKKSSWSVKGTKNRISFNRIVDRLQANADRLARRSGDFDAVRVVGIDLTANPKLASATRVKSKSRNRRSVRPRRSGRRTQLAQRR